MFKMRGAGVKGRLNNVKKNRQFGPVGRPLVSESLSGRTKWGVFHFHFCAFNPEIISNLTLKDAVPRRHHLC